MIMSSEEGDPVTALKIFSGGVSLGSMTDFHWREKRSSNVRPI